MKIMQLMFNRRFGYGASLEEVGSKEKFLEQAVKQIKHALQEIAKLPDDKLIEICEFEELEDVQGESKD